uniref:NADH-ubiquinone oxidoreductase chain 4 n=1 Tax=Moniezia expansa TaxID=28841 RepID=A0A343A6Y7_MONEX|nr:NADH dehydrogenase subunit 4 [Moniezia expansa]AOY40437.1 NADH dehydrogenase subunit 4 [Moniezia expansa]
MFKYFSVSSVLIVALLWVILEFVSYSQSLAGGSDNMFGNFFIIDSISVYLMILVVLLGVYSQLFFFGSLSLLTRLFLFLSLICSFLCYCVNHSILFWCFYELSMLPLLYLVFSESPYSERFLAGWYFACYLLITSLPLLLILLYMSVIEGSFFFNSWCCVDFSFWVFVVVCFIFFTKVPFFPFHTWLPIVHAEATSIVSIFLSGYIMKLGILGVYRCSSCLLNCDFMLYLFFCCLAGVLFLVVANGELDGKRWLAFLSLAHIVVPFLAFFISSWESVSLSFFYCLGHGLSAGIIFGLLWYFYELTNSRNWLLLKSGVSGSVVLVILVVSLLSVCSFPPTIQFFCEVGLVSLSGGVLIYILFWCFYLFFGGLVPLILCGHLLLRVESIETCENSMFNYLNFLFILCVWCYIGFMFF